MTHTPASPSPADTPNPTERPSAAQEFIDLLRTVGAALLLAMGLQSVAFQPYTIPSSSMEPGLVTGDYVVTSKSPYGWSRASLPFDPPLGSGRLFGRDPARGDVVVVTDLRSTNGTRVINPGQPTVLLAPGDSMALGVGAIIDLGDGNRLEVLG